MSELSRDQKRLLVKFALRSPAFQRRLTACGDTHQGWETVSELPYRVYWITAQQLLGETKRPTCFSHDVIWAKFWSLPESQGLQSNPAMQEEVNALIVEIANAKPEELDPQVAVVNRIFNTFLEYRLAMPQATAEMEELAKTRPDVTLREKNQILENHLKKYGTVAVDPDDFMNPDVPLPTRQLVTFPFGIDWLDRMTEGGMAEGDAMLFIAPSGGGKTVFGTQVAWSKAKLLKHVCYLSYEQLIETDVAADIMIRFYAMATRRSKNQFKNVDFRTLHPDIIAALNEMRQRYGRHTHTYDMSRADRGFGGVDEIRSVLDAETRKGQRPELMIVDWVQTAVGRYMAAKQIKDAEMTTQMDIFARDFALMCRDEKINGIMLQQMDTENQAKKNIEPHHTLAAKCKSMGNYCRFAFGIARLNKDGFGRMTRTKGTSVGGDQNVETLVRLRGELNEFVDATQDVVYDDRSGEFVPRESVRTSEMRVGAM
jgi:hypothetical protein